MRGHIDMMADAHCLKFYIYNIESARLRFGIIQYSNKKIKFLYRLGGKQDFLSFHYLRNDSRMNAALIREFFY